MKENYSNVLKSLQGEQLAGITFIRDYMQFLFDGPIINAYTLPVLKIEGREYLPQNAGYRDALCSQITKFVVSTSETPNEKIVIFLTDSAELSFSLKDEKKSGPDALLIQINPEKWNVW